MFTDGPVSTCIQVTTMRRRLSNPLGSSAARSVETCPRDGTTTSPLRQPPLPRLPAKKEIDEAVKPSEECACGQLVVGLLQPAMERPARVSNVLPEARTPAMGKPARIAIKAGGRILFIDTADIVAVEAKGNYVVLLHTSNSHLLRESISTIEEKLNLHGFVRIHRSMLVNAALVEEILPLSSGDYVLRVRGGKELTATRTYKKNLQLLAHLWIGTEGFAVE